MCVIIGGEWDWDVFFDVWFRCWWFLVWYVWVLCVWWWVWFGFGWICLGWLVVCCFCFSLLMFVVRCWRFCCCFCCDSCCCLGRDVGCVVVFLVWCVLCVRWCGFVCLVGWVGDISCCFVLVRLLVIWVYLVFGWCSGSWCFVVLVVVVRFCLVFLVCCSNWLWFVLLELLGCRSYVVSSFVLFWWVICFGWFLGFGWIGCCCWRCVCVVFGSINCGWLILWFCLFILWLGVVGVCSLVSVWWDIVGVMWLVGCCGVFVVWWNNVLFCLGGCGYVCGVFGLLYWWRLLWGFLVGLVVGWKCFCCYGWGLGVCIVGWWWMFCWYWCWFWLGGCCVMGNLVDWGLWVFVVGLCLFFCVMF